MREEELQRLDVGAAPAAHLHHEALDALEDELCPLEAPGHRHLLRHLVREQQRHRHARHLVQASLLQHVPQADDEGMSAMQTYLAKNKMVR